MCCGDALNAAFRQLRCGHMQRHHRRAPASPLAGCTGSNCVQLLYTSQYAFTATTSQQGTVGRAWHSISAAHNPVCCKVHPKATYKGRLAHKKSSLAFFPKKKNQRQTCTYWHTFVPTHRADGGAVIAPLSLCGNTKLSISLFSACPSLKRNSSKHHTISKTFECNSSTTASS